MGSENEDIARTISSLKPEEVLAYLDNLDPSQLQLIVTDDTFQPEIRAGALSIYYVPGEALNILESLGHQLTKTQLYNVDINAWYDITRSLYDELFYATLAAIAPDFHDSLLNSDNRLDSIYDVISRIVSHLNSNLSFTGHDPQFKSLVQFYSSSISVISDPLLLSGLFDQVYTPHHVLIQPMRKQLHLVYLRFFQTTVSEYMLYEGLQYKEFPFKSVEIANIHTIPFDDLYIMLKLDIIPDLKHLVLSEFDDQETLISLFILSSFKGLRDRMLSKLNFDSTIRILQEHKVYDIIYLIQSNELLHRIFYEIDVIEVKAVIAKRLKDNTLAFEVLSNYFENDARDYLSDDMTKELFLLLKLKQLALLRLSLPNEFHLVVQRMIEEKEKREKNDRSFFA